MRNVTYIRAPDKMRIVMTDMSGGRINDGRCIGNRQARHRLITLSLSGESGVISFRPDRHLLRFDHRPSPCPPKLRRRAPIASPTSRLTLLRRTSSNSSSSPPLRRPTSSPRPYSRRTLSSSTATGVGGELSSSPFFNTLSLPLISTELSDTLRWERYGADDDLRNGSTWAAALLTIADIRAPRASWIQTELLLTFPTPAVRTITLIPLKAEETGGRFRVWVDLGDGANPHLVWDRKVSQLTSASTSACAVSGLLLRLSERTLSSQEDPRPLRGPVGYGLEAPKRFLRRLSSVTAVATRVCLS